MRWILFVVLATGLSGGILLVRGAGTERRDEPARASALAAAGPGDRAHVLIDDRQQQLLGVRVARVVRGTHARPVRLAGTVRYDETRLTDVNLRLDGWIDELNVTHVGQSVSRGQSLFTFHSPEMLAAQNDLLAALRSRELLPASPASDAQDYRDRLVETPRQRLLQWGVPEDELRAIEQQRAARAAVVFRAPVSGVVIEKTVINGMFVESGATLYRIADLSVVWMEVDVPELDVAQVRVGARADATTRAWPGERFSGRDVNVDPFVTEGTRTLKARVALANPGARLKPGMFAAVDLSVTAREGLLVPMEAVVDSGLEQVVFVARGDSQFEPRRVRIGERGDGQVLILDGLHEGEEVVARAAYFVNAESQLRAELLRADDTSPKAARAPSHAADVTFTFRTTPDPSRTGDNIVEVRVRDAHGTAVTDADVRVIFSMPPMPSMNMPAMRSEANLTHRTDGLYAGPANIAMRGRWDVMVTADRAGHALAEHHTSVMVRD